MPTLVSNLGKLNDLDVSIIGVNVLRPERSEEDKLELAADSGEVEDVLDGDLPVHRVHEHVKLVEDAEGWTHGLPEGQDEGHAGVGLLSPREAADVPADVKGSRVVLDVGVDADGELTVLVVEV